MKKNPKNTSLETIFLKIVYYRIQRGAYDDFVIDADTGTITLSGQLDYDRRDSYTLELVAVDKGVPVS